MPLDAATDKRVVISSPNRTEWLTHFGVSKSGGSMSAFYEYFSTQLSPWPLISCMLESYTTITAVIADQGYHCMHQIYRRWLRLTLHSEHLSWAREDMLLEQLSLLWDTNSGGHTSHRLASIPGLAAAVDESLRAASVPITGAARLVDITSVVQSDLWGQLNEHDWSNAVVPGLQPWRAPKQSRCAIDGPLVDRRRPGILGY